MKSGGGSGRTDVTAEYVVVGAGITGASIAAHLAGRGAPPLILEAGQPGCGATRVSGGMVRGYDPDPTTAELASSSIARYAEPSGWNTGVAPLHRVGAVTLAWLDQSEDLRRAQGELRAASGLDAHVVSDAGGSEVAGVRLAGAVALVEPTAGYVDPVSVTRLFVRQAVRDGSRLMTGTRLEAVSGTGGRILLRCAGLTVRARIVVLALGGWTSRPPSGVHVVGALIGTRSIQACVIRRPIGVPPHTTFVDLRTGCYGRPMTGRRSLIGFPLTVWGVDPDSDPAADIGHHRRTLEEVRRFLPWVPRGQTVRLVRSFDGYCDKADLLLRTRSPGVWSVRVGNGGGVRVAPELGRRVAEQLLARPDA
ncbi:glycine/D-amino acid oxidase-like deaminating enzyme [Catenulispora sp. MAP5-51]|uniref:NAD(P)/FAD-dependent oxidoreductase n=1 Tax=Catenulispora sp. MAP5-51 TaxID=3156298 RepID=UPI0035196143